jgi:hypothetical protein
MVMLLSIWKLVKRLWRLIILMGTLRNVQERTGSLIGLGVLVATATRLFL